MYSDKTVTCLGSKTLVAFPVHALWLKCSVQRRMYLVDHGCTLLRFCTVGSAKVETEVVEDEVEHNPIRTSVHIYYAGYVQFKPRP